MIDLPSLHHLCKNHQISKAALFVLDRSAEIYEAREVEGFDETTARRLRIPGTFITPPGNGRWNPFILKAKEISSLKEFFSHKAFLSLERLLFLPLETSKDELISFIMIADNAFLKERGLAFLRSFKTIVDEYTQKGDEWLNLPDAIYCVTDADQIAPQNPEEREIFYRALEDQAKETFDNPETTCFIDNHLLITLCTDFIAEQDLLKEHWVRTLTNRWNLDKKRVDPAVDIIGAEELKGLAPNQPE